MKTCDVENAYEGTPLENKSFSSADSMASSVAVTKHGVKVEMGCPVSGPGLVVMLADSDAGSLIIAAQSGKVWGYTLVPLQLILALPLYMAQELTVRLGTCTEMGFAKLVSTYYGKFWGALICCVLCCICIGALISEYTAIIGVGSMVGIPPVVSCALVSTGLFFITLQGNYEEVERKALVLGCFEFAFFITMLLAAPSPRELVEGVVNVPYKNKDFQILVAANIGAVMQPWMIFYQQSAVVDKGTKKGMEMDRARHETKWGAFITQMVAIAVMLTAAGTVWNHDNRNPDVRGFETVQEVSSTLTSYLGVTGEVLFAFGFFGSAAIGAVVVSLTAVWSISEISGWHGSLKSSCSEAPMFYTTFACILIFSSYAALADFNHIVLNVGIQVLNALLLPLILGFLYLMSTHPHILPKEHRLTGVTRVVYAISFTLCSGIGMWCCLAMLS